MHSPNSRAVPGKRGSAPRGGFRGDLHDDKARLRKTSQDRAVFVEGEARVGWLVGDGRKGSGKGWWWWW
jgi:hypothetical protein